MSPRSEPAGHEPPIPGCARRRWWVAGAVACASLVALWVPWPERAPAPPAGGTPFAWRQDARWRSLEGAFRAARAAGCGTVTPRITAALEAGRRLMAGAAARRARPDDPDLDEIERSTFEAGAMAAACPETVATYAGFVATTRAAVKRLSERWDIAEPATRAKLYRLLYGGRAALEEAMLQAPARSVPALVRGEEEPSATPSAAILGVTVHSGDLLVSRGGVPTSALIARGNDFPGNFSHVALVHVERGSGPASVVEAHIERGVAVASLPQYLADVKLRVMVLRLRSDLPQVVRDPLLPHRAAAWALEEATRRHIPYDFEMDSTDHARVFCSEVASAAYERVGVSLWMGVSRISSPGLVAWLSGFGVRHFETREPSDLEYDPQLRVVAEWRDPAALFADHLDNAVVDAMLERADAGGPLAYPWLMLGPARLAKAYSVLLNLLGRVGPVPEGLSATGALRNREFTRTHAAVREVLVRRAAEFERVKGYRPPYWELVRLAREARVELRRGR
ncbi:MAG TPA: YiiX/YebB-like N1pC/P60 family cysteine hydrolase [Thermoanaerobaculaceae bacterium]|nr:YiiX/YebB-like N1pC/P60 family cysteine hydrolase [Thermoanaerobaculaceae bacterium]